MGFSVFDRVHKIVDKWHIPGETLFMMRNIFVIGGQQALGVDKTATFSRILERNPLVNQRCDKCVSGSNTGFACTEE